MCILLDNSTNYGFVYAASGQGYTDLAILSARSLRKVSPDAEIDLFTDCPVGDGHPFDNIYSLDRSWFRPKFEALLKSRFDRTVYLDADTFVVADISDIFEVLEHHEFAAAPVIRTNYADNRRIWKKSLPLAVPRYNCGLIGIQNSDRVHAFLQKVQDVLISEDLDHDQSLMREMLFESDIRVVTLPYEYNFNEITLIDILSDRFCAPRVLHFWRMRDHLVGSGVSQMLVEDLLGPARSWFLERHRNNDAYLGAKEVVPMPSIAALRADESEQMLAKLAKTAGEWQDQKP